MRLFRKRNDDVDTLAPGEYVFKCLPCEGKGSIEVGYPGDPDDPEDSEPYSLWEDCEDCEGTGKVTLDEEEAAEMIEYGHKPLRTP